MDSVAVLRLKQRIAKEHGVPFELAHTINLRKYLEYKKFLSSPQGEIEQYLDFLEGQRHELEKKEAKQVRKEFRKLAKKILFPVLVLTLLFASVLPIAAQTVIEREEHDVIFIILYGSEAFAMVEATNSVLYFDRTNKLLFFAAVNYATPSTGEVQVIGPMKFTILRGEPAREFIKANGGKNFVVDFKARTIVFAELPKEIHT